MSASAMMRSEGREDSLLDEGRGGAGVLLAALVNAAGAVCTVQGKLEGGAAEGGGRGMGVVIAESKACSDGACNEVGGKTELSRVCGGEDQGASSTSPDTG